MIKLPVQITCREPGKSDPPADPHPPGGPNEPGDPAEPDLLPVLSDLPAGITLYADQGSQASTSFSFRNSGTADLTWSLHSNLGLSLEPTSGTLAPEEFASVAVASNCTADFTGSLQLLSNDPERPEVLLPVMQTCNPATPPPAADGLNIELVFLGAGFLPEYRQEFQTAAAKWSSVITSDLTALRLTTPQNACGRGEPVIDQVIDDVLIHVILQPLGDYVLGSAGPCYLRWEDGLPLYGTVTLNSRYIAQMLANGGLYSTALHEIGHVLGIGTLWDNFALLDFDAGSHSDCNSILQNSMVPSFNGAGARSEYALLRDAGNLVNVPVEHQYGPGTNCGHWTESVFGNEVMTGVANQGAQPLSRLTIASLQDVGYEVDFSQAEPYSLPVSGTSFTPQADETRFQDILLFPVPLPPGAAAPLN